MDWTRIISAGVGPIIVISACGLLCLAFYNRLAAIITRLRAFHREQLHEQEALAREQSAGTSDEMALVRHHEVLGMLKVQIERVTRRAIWIRRTLACLLLTIACLAVCSLAVGLSVIWPACGYAAVPLFVVGLVMLVVGVVLAMIELHYALDPVTLETRFLAELTEDFQGIGSGQVGGK